MIFRKKITNLFFIALLVFGLLSFGNMALAVDKKPKESAASLVTGGITGAATEAGFAELPAGNASGNLSGLIGAFIGALLAFVGLLFFGLMIYGGFLWMTARGNDEQVKKAQDLIQAAIIGLVIVLSAYAVTAYIGGALIS